MEDRDGEREEAEEGGEEGELEEGVRGCMRVIEKDDGDDGSAMDRSRGARQRGPLALSASSYSSQSGRREGGREGNKASAGWGGRG